MIRSIAPRVTRYRLWQLPSTTTVGAPSTRANVDVSPISFIDLTEMEQARAGSAKLAGGYLRAGHHGVVLRSEGAVAAWGWYVINTTDRVKRVKGYHPLRPNHALLHGDWTHPSHRRRGMQSTSLSTRVSLIRAAQTGITIEAAILPSNLQSEHNYLTAGFSPADSLTVITMGRWSFGRLH